jgi:hypothetical protein
MASGNSRHISRPTPNLMLELSPRPGSRPSRTHSRRHAGIISGLLAALLAADLAAQDSEGEGASKQAANGSNHYSAELRVGGEYDSNVSVDEVDVASEQSDYALLLEGHVEYQRRFANDAQFSLGYDLSQSLYDEFSRLDRQTHIISGDLNAGFGETDIGISYHYVDSRLDGDDFLTMQRSSVYGSRFLSRKWFSRMAYVYTDKDIVNRSDRDADTDAGEFDLYWFRQGLRSYFNVGYRYKDENANADRFDYKSNSFKLRYIQRFELFDRLAKLELAWRYEDRDYSSPTPEIGEDRSDERQRWQVQVEIPVLEQAAVIVYYNFNNYDSNLERADYRQNIAGGEFVYRW